VTLVPLRLFRFIPPSLLRAIPLLSVRRLLLRSMNAALKRQPMEFEIVTPFGFRFAGNTRDVIQRHVYVFGVWEPDVTAWMTSNVTPGSVVVDVGANVGYFTLLLAELVGPNGIVHSVEPLPSTVRHLRENIELNPNPGGVVVHDVACSESEGTTEVFRADSIGNSSTSWGEHSEGLVSCRTLDLLLKQTEPGLISLIKIDAEGDEMGILVGASRTLALMSSGAAVLVEVTPEMLLGRGFVANDPLKLMDEAGFDAYAIDNDYTPARYADRRVRRPERLLVAASTDQEVLFIKR